MLDMAEHLIGFLRAKTDLLSLSRFASKARPLCSSQPTKVASLTSIVNVFLRPAQADRQPAGVNVSHIPHSREGGIFIIMNALQDDGGLPRSLHQYAALAALKHFFKLMGGGKALYA